MASVPSLASIALNASESRVAGEACLRTHDLVARGAGGEALREAIPERCNDLLQPRSLDGRRHIIR